MGKTKKIMLTIFTILFVYGIALILSSDSPDMGSVGNMNLAGAIISVFAGVGLLCEIYINKD